jgi:type VI protein secretion system component VasF
MQSPEPHPEQNRRDNDDERRLGRMLFWIGLGVGVAALGATLAYIAFRLTADRREDPTTQRIQQLIDEANSLLKALDEQRNSA